MLKRTPIYFFEFKVIFRKKVSGKAYSTSLRYKTLNMNRKSVPDLSTYRKAGFEGYSWRGEAALIADWLCMHYTYSL